MNTVVNFHERTAPVQVAAQLDKILKASIAFKSHNKVGSEEQPALQIANHSCTESSGGRLFRDAVATPGGQFKVCWQSEYTANNTQTLADAKHAAKMHRRKRQRFTELKVCTRSTYPVYCLRLGVKPVRMRLQLVNASVRTLASTAGVHCCSHRHLCASGGHLVAVR